MSGRTLRYILVGALALAIGIPSVAIGFGEGRTMLLGKRNPSPNASRALNARPPAGLRLPPSSARPSPKPTAMDGIPIASVSAPTRM